MPAKLSARARLFDTGHDRKTDPHDAHAVAAVAVRTSGLRVLAYDEALEALRMVADRRAELAQHRVQTTSSAASLRLVLPARSRGRTDARIALACNAVRLLLRRPRRQLRKKTVEPVDG